MFDDDNALYFDDERHSQDEERFIVIGMSEKFNILMVCHCYRNGRNGDNLIRLISARKANKQETAQYRKQGKQEKEGGYL